MINSPPQKKKKEDEKRGPLWERGLEKQEELSVPGYTGGGGVLTKTTFIINIPKQIERRRKGSKEVSDQDKKRGIEKE